MSDEPLVSICIPTLDNLDRLDRCLRSIRRTCIDLDYEIVIVDNGNKPRGYVAPANQALRAGKGQYRVSLNDDVVCTPRWLHTLLEAAENHPEALVVFPDQESTDGIQCLCGWALMFTPAGWERFNGYDDRYTLWASDVDLAHRCYREGIPPLRVPLPEPLEHDLNVTIGRRDFSEYMSPAGMTDLDIYREKWGTDCLQDKFNLIAATV